MSGAYLELSQTSKMKRFGKIDNGKIGSFAKFSLLDVWQCSEYASGRRGVFILFCCRYFDWV